MLTMSLDHKNFSFPIGKTEVPTDDVTYMAPCKLYMTPKLFHCTDMVGSSGFYQPES